MKLKYVTLTGIDITTSQSDILMISSQRPYVEWGILISEKNESERFMPITGVQSLLEAVRENEKRIKLSFHFCGKSVANVINMLPDYMELISLAHSVADLRIQLNFNHNSGKINVAQLLWFIKRIYPINVIVQINWNNRQLPSILSGIGNANYLFDSSGGTGKLMQEIEKPLTSLDYRGNIFTPLCGYAGGISIHNLFETLGRLGAVVPTDTLTWIDMESSIRTNGLFDIEKARIILDNLNDTTYVV